MIQAFVWKPTEDDLVLINKLISTLFKEELQVVDLSVNPKPIVNGRLLLAFGTRCFNIISSTTKQEVLLFTTPAKLHPVDANKKTRKETFERLKEISKEHTQLQTTTLSKDDLKSFLIDRVLTLEKTLKEQNKTSWKGKTKSGKTIALVTDINTKITDCQIVLTFEELFAAKFALDILNLETLIINEGEEKQ